MAFGLPGEGLRGSETGSPCWAETEPLKVSEPPDPESSILIGSVGPSGPCVAVTHWWLPALWKSFRFALSPSRCFFLPYLPLFGGPNGIDFSSDTWEQTACFFLVCRVGYYDCVLVLAIDSRKLLRTWTFFKALGFS